MNFLTTSKRIFELTLFDHQESDLDTMLAKLFAILEDTPEIPLDKRGAIYLTSIRQQLVGIAQYGLDAHWSVVDGDTSLGVIDPCSSATSEIRQINGQFVYALPLKNGGQQLGLALFFPRSNTLPTPELLPFLDDMSRALASQVVRKLTSETLLVREIELEDARTDAIHRLGIASEFRDNETGWHVMRMTHYATAIAKQLGLPDEQRELLAITAPMHDVGKIGISDSILLKPGKLTPEEFEDMKRHAEIGERILEGEDTLIRAAREIASSHHERWDGKGYPRGLKGENIPILGRVCSIADVFDALTSNRPYKKAWTQEEAIDLIRSESGKQFDPAVVDAFDAALPEIQRIKELYCDEVIDPSQVLSLPPLPRPAQSWVEWSDALSVGIDVIDEHHRYLIDLINDLYDVVVSRQGIREISRVLKALDTYAQVHFRTEEKMMSHYGYDRLGEQRHQHHAFEDKLREFFEELHINPVTTRIEILVYLRDWMISHILHEDAQLRTLVQPAA